MKKNAGYFQRNVMMVVELEDETGGRFRREMPDVEVDIFLKGLGERGYGLSDLDYSSRQPDEWCRKVLNTAEWNWRKNRGWIKEMGFKSLDEVIDWIIENEKVK